MLDYKQIEKKNYNLTNTELLTITNLEQLTNIETILREVKPKV